VGKIKSPDFLECLRKGKIKQFSSGSSVALKEWTTAEEDLEEAKESLSRKKYKWSTIQSYYAMFHAARALIYKAGYREHNHYCLRIALRALYVETGLLEAHHIEIFHMAKNLRENADYHGNFSSEDAEHLYQEAINFLKAAGSILKNY